MENPIKILLLEDNSSDAGLIQYIVQKVKNNCEFQTSCPSRKLTYSGFVN